MEKNIKINHRMLGNNKYLLYLLYTFWREKMVEISSNAITRYISPYCYNVG